VTDQAQLVAEIAADLRRQLACVAGGDLDQLAPAVARLEGIIARLSSPEPPGMDEVRDLHRRLRLAVADRRQAVADRLAAARAARPAVRAYGRNAAEI
jgi:hypothetical protein